jgi:hypothetical protein
MAWDPALMRKYNNTGHFRLLNQLRSELKNHPIQRSTKEEPGVAKESSLGGSPRTKEIRPQTYQANRTRRSANSNESTVNIENNKEQTASSSFRDRLNAIEMR